MTFRRRWHGFSRMATLALTAISAWLLCAHTADGLVMPARPCYSSNVAPLVVQTHPISASGSRRSAVVLFGKKDKRKGGGGGSKQQQPQQEKQSVKDARFDALTRQFMFTMVGLSKTLPDKSKQILKNIHLSFYPGAKIGVVGLNGSGKAST